MSTSIASLLSQELSGPDAVVTDPARLAASGHDYWGHGGTPDLMLRPRSTEEVSAIMRIAHERGVPVIPRGGASNCSSGMMPARDRILLDLSGLNEVLEVDIDARRARVQSGVINAALQELLAPHGLCFSPDPVSRALSTIGGNIIENAGGPHALKYGVTYNHILAAVAVLPDGRVIRLEADSDGPDLLGLLIGSEGTLAIVTEATLALRPLPAVTRSLLASFETAHEAAAAASAIIKTGTVPAALEWLDSIGIAGLEKFTSTGYPTDAAAILLIDVDGDADQVDRDVEIVGAVLRRTAREVRRADDEAARASMWYGRLHAPDAALRSGQAFFIGDITVPRERIPEMQDAIQAAAERHRDGLSFIAVMGHAGDGNLHPTSFYDPANPRSQQALKDANDEIVDAALGLGGTITGEHGVGTAKRRFMTKRFTPVEIAAQRAIKRVFDPGGCSIPTSCSPRSPPRSPASRASRERFATPSVASARSPTGPLPRRWAAR